MPDGTPRIRHDASRDRTERLNNAIDRMMSGGPAPVLNDPELHDLLQLATRLRNELPQDLPDPAFRLDLKRQLTAVGPVPVATRRPRVATQPRFPWVAAVSAIAAIMLAAISVGSLGIWLYDDSRDSSGTTELARLPATRQTATMLGFATMTAATLPGNPAPANETGVAAEPTSDAADEPDDEPSDPQPTSAETIPPSGASVVSTAPATATASMTVTAEPTTGTALAAVPPVDAQHVEQGPATAADGGSGGPPGEIDYRLETDLPDFGATGEVYRLVPPKDDPETFVAEVAAELDFEGEITSDAPMGRTVYHIFDDDGSFHWTPETGAFTVAVTDTGTGESMTVEELTDRAIAWLESINYPVEQLASEVQTTPIGETSWLLNVRYATMPDVGLGHQIGVNIFISDDGAISEVSGYWLNIKQVDAAPLLSADTIWQAVSSGEGYWTGGGIVEDGGEFRAESMRITYILTRDPSGELVLQPVVETEGEFVTADGLSSARISCFVQAAQTTGDSTP